MAGLVSRRVKLAYLVSLFSVLLVSVLFGYLEYNFVEVSNVPLREARQPLIGIFYSYQLGIFFPIIAIVAFSQFLQELTSRAASMWSIKQTLALGAAGFLLGVLLEDISWFAFRAFAPVSSDPLAHHWILPSDPSAYSLGYANIFGGIVPLWYIVIGSPAIAMIIALFILPHND
ncbi:MAG: hypothetical protein M1368_05390 [Thaumarchaeota archaeon]|nr:hypothetical protein [Nitrososphaerota archaeon]